MRYGIFVLSLVCPFIWAQEPTPKLKVWAESEDDFPNPERGFHRFRNLLQPSNLGIRTENKTLIYAEINASAFRDRPLSAEFLATIQNGFDQVRKNGLKANPRFIYSNGIGQPDAPLAIVLGHISQMQPLWGKNLDVINVLDPGFIGAWGEWHSSTNQLDSKENRAKIIEALLVALPKERMMVIRQPRFKREYLTGDPWGGSPLINSEAFKKTAATRIGHLNDCFLSSPDDVGTYTGWSLTKELDYLSKDSRFVPWGGETCAVHARGDCANAIQEMEILHANYLNADYHGDVIDKWQKDGCLDVISKRLGYRFSLVKTQLPDSVLPGGILTVNLTIKNSGFAELFNPREVEIILSKNGVETLAVLPDDPRFWGAGDTISLITSLSIPKDQAEGLYTLGIRLADPAPTLRRDSRYAVRLANAEVWENATGTNILHKSFAVSKLAKGAYHPDFTSFKVYAGSTSIAARTTFRHPRFWTPLPPGQYLWRNSIRDKADGQAPIWGIQGRRF